MTDPKDRIAALQKQLDERNEATRVWIQSDTQCRAYANRLETALEAAMRGLEGIAEGRGYAPGEEPSEVLEARQAMTAIRKRLGGEHG